MCLSLLYFIKKLKKAASIFKKFIECNDQNSDGFFERYSSQQRQLLG